MGSRVVPGEGIVLLCRPLVRGGTECGPGPRERTLAPRGLLLIGLDVIGDAVTDINVTSPTSLQEITAQTALAAPALVVDALQTHLAAA